jgi:hypothetical protein
MRPDPFLDQYEDVLQNIEFAIISVYRQRPEMTDFQVDKVLDGLIRIYQAELRGKSAPNLRFSDLESEVYERVKTVCDWRLKRTGPMAENEEGETEEVMVEKALTVDEIIACLKRIRSSVKFWTKERGRKGYLDFINPYIL